MGANPGKWRIVFYQDQRSECPPLEFIDRLGAADRAKIDRCLELLAELGTRIQAPHAKHLEDALWELRPTPHRLIYFAHTGRVFVILHAFTKKTQKTPRREIGIARRRMQDVIERG